MQRISPKGNTPPDSKTIIKRQVGGSELRKPVNNGVFGVTVQDSPYNPIISFNKQKRDFSLFFEHESMLKNVAYYKFKNLQNATNNLSLMAWNVNRMLYARGGLVAFNHIDGAGNVQGHLLPFNISGHNGLNFYGLPDYVEPIPYADNMRFTNLQNVKLKVGVDCVIWLDSIPFEPSLTPMSRRFYNTIINNQKAEAITRVLMSMVAHFEKQIIQVDNPQKAEKLKIAFRTALESGDPVAVVTDFFETNKELFKGVTYVGGEFFATLKDFQSLQDSYNGISTSGYGIEKAERLVAGELSGIGEQVDLLADLRRRMAKRFAKECQRVLKWVGFDIETNHIPQTEKMDMKKQENNGTEESVGGKENVN